MKSKKNANGNGSIRSFRNGYQGRCTIGFDSNGKQIQKSVYGKTKTEVRKKITEIMAKVDVHQYVEPSQMSLKEWAYRWLIIVRGTVVSRTYDSYRGICQKHIIPALGGIQLRKLHALEIQDFYSSLINEKQLSEKTVKNVAGVMSVMLNKAVEMEYLATNPCSKCEIPKQRKKEIHPLETSDISSFLEMSKGDRFYEVFFFAVFSGLRFGEILGLTWDCVSFEDEFVYVNKQLAKDSKLAGSHYVLEPTKNGKPRIVPLSQTVIHRLKEIQTKQQAWEARAGKGWENEWNLVFTDEVGKHLCDMTIRKHLKKIAQTIGRPDLRFHDLRHTFAVVSLENGDDIKTVQENLGHATASFTLNVYGHVSERMRKKSASNMEKYIKNNKIN